MKRLSVILIVSICLLSMNTRAQVDLTTYTDEFDGPSLNANWVTANADVSISGGFLNLTPTGDSQGWLNTNNINLNDLPYPFVFVARRDAIASGGTGGIPMGIMFLDASDQFVTQVDAWQYYDNISSPPVNYFAIRPAWINFPAGNPDLTNPCTFSFEPTSPDFSQWRIGWRYDDGANYNYATQDISADIGSIAKLQFYCQGHDLQAGPNNPTGVHIPYQFDYVRFFTASQPTPTPTPFVEVDLTTFNDEFDGPTVNTNWAPSNASASASGGKLNLTASGSGVQGNLGTTLLPLAAYPYPFTFEVRREAIATGGTGGMPLGLIFFDDSDTELFRLDVWQYWVNDDSTQYIGIRPDWLQFSQYDDQNQLPLMTQPCSFKFEPLSADFKQWKVSYRYAESGAFDDFQLVDLSAQPEFAKFRFNMTCHDLTAGPNTPTGQTLTYLYDYVRFTVGIVQVDLRDFNDEFDEPPHNAYWTTQNADASVADGKLNLVTLDGENPGSFWVDPLLVEAIPYPFTFEVRREAIQSGGTGGMPMGMIFYDGLDTPLFRLDAWQYWVDADSAQFIGIRPDWLQFSQYDGENQLPLMTQPCTFKFEPLSPDFTLWKVYYRYAETGDFDDEQTVDLSGQSQFAKFRFYLSGHDITAGPNTPTGQMLTYPYDYVRFVVPGVNAAGDGWWCYP